MRAVSSQLPLAVDPSRGRVLASGNIRLPAVVTPEAYMYDRAGEYAFAERAGVAYAKALKLFKEAIALPGCTKAVLVMGLPGAGKSTFLSQGLEPGAVYFDATLTLRSQRAAVINMARAANRPVEVVWVDTPLAVCLASNARRHPSRRVAPDAIVRQNQNLRSEPPEAREGYTRLRRITVR